MSKPLNTAKLIFKAVGQGYEGDPALTSLIDIQDWIIYKYNIIPCVNWDTLTKSWKAYVYDYEYEPLSWIKKIKATKELSAKEATQLLDNYIKTNYVVKDKDGHERFHTATEALYYAIEKSFEKIFK